MRGERICPQDWTIFTPGRSDQVYCAQRCRKRKGSQRWLREERICPQDWTIFTPRRGTQVYCTKQCRKRKGSQSWYEENKEKALEKSRRRYEENREEELEKRRRWHEKNRDKRREQHRRHYEENKEKVLEKSRRWYEENKEKALEIRRQWEATHPGSRADRALKRRCRMMDATVQKVERLVVFERDGDTCQICLDRVDTTLKKPHPMAPQLDHIIPISRGGHHSYDNIQLAHARCNQRKSNKMPHELVPA